MDHVGIGGKDCGLLRIIDVLPYLPLETESLI